MHRGQYRKSGEPFIVHPIAVTAVLADYGLDVETLVAALLHDTVEDTDLTLDEVRQRFGEQVALMIDGVTKLDRIKFGSQEEAQAATIRKMVVAMAQDVRVLLIKLADRLHNLRTISALRPEKQQRIAKETLEVYAPLAHRLGMEEVKHEMEDRCFAVLQPLRYDEIQEQLAARTPERDAYLEKVMTEVRGALQDAGVDASVTGRPKHPYSIYRKMVAIGQAFSEIHDIIGIRITTEEMRDCYAALGVIHAMWPPVQGRFKDYIAMPKFNLYQSLHTTVIGSDGRPLEVQIRTREMNRRAESGIAAHWRYKEGGGAADLQWMADVRFLHEEYRDPNEFLAGLKLDLYQDEVFVLTPAGDVRTLPRGATPVDFAYTIHTEVGNRCVGARVNGRLVSLGTRLESGDIVEILTSKSPDAGPSRDWLGFVRTSRARAKIKQWFSKERREVAVAEGRDQIAAALRKEGLGLSAAERDRQLESVSAEMGLRDLDALFAAVGESSTSAATVVARIVRNVRPQTRGRRGPARDANQPTDGPERSRDSRRGLRGDVGADRPLLCAGPWRRHRRLCHRGEGGVGPPLRLHEHRGDGCAPRADDRCLLGARPGRLLHHLGPGGGARQDPAAARRDLGHIGPGGQHRRLLIRNRSRPGSGAPLRDRALRSRPGAATARGVAPGRGCLRRIPPRTPGGWHRLSARRRTADGRRRQDGDGRRRTAKQPLGRNWGLACGFTC